MKKRSIIFVLIIIAMLLLSGCTSVDIKEDELKQVSQADSSEDLEKLPEGYILVENRANNIEFHEDRIYGLYKWINPDDKNDWTEALWCFSPYEDAKLIAKGKGLNFRVSKNNKYIATSTQGDIQFYNKNGELLHTISKEKINNGEYPTLQLSKWNENGDTLWCELSETYNTIAYIKIDTETWEFVKYSDLNFMSAEHILNPNTGKILYSDYPVLLDITSLEEYEKSNELTTLSIYNLMTKEKIDIESAEANKFNPKWINDNEILYYIGGKRFFYRLEEN